jgi:NTE family protein
MNMNKDRVGLVLSGGGAKGAYQVGVIKYLAEAGIEIQAVSGASIGALNGSIIAGAINLKAAYQTLNDLWQALAKEPPLKLNGVGVGSYLAYFLLMGSSRFSPISRSVLLSAKTLKKTSEALPKWVKAYIKELNILNNIDFSLVQQSPIRALIDRYTSPEVLAKGLPLYLSAYQTDGIINDLANTALGMLGISDTKASRFFHVQSFSCDKQQDVIFASAALPVLFTPQNIDGEAYSDGGLGGWRKSQGNTPIAPLVEQEKCSHVIVTHLTDGSSWDRHDFPNTTILEIRPKVPITKESQFKDLLSFKASKINEWIDQGYDDAKRCIGQVKDVIDLQKTSQDAILKRNVGIEELDDDFYIE